MVYLYFVLFVVLFGFINDEYDVCLGELFNLKFECDIVYDVEIFFVWFDFDIGVIEYDLMFFCMFYF